MSRQVEQINTGEDDEEATEQRDRADGIGGIESLEENKRGTDRGGRKGDIVEGVDTKSQLISATRGSVGLSTHIEVEKEFKALLK